MIDDPLDVFLEDFAEDDKLVFEWTNGNGEPCCAEVKAIYDNAFFDVNIGETVLDTTQPRLTCKHSEAKDIPREATVSIRSKSYSVTQVQPDGTGFATITLAYE